MCNCNIEPTTNGLPNPQGLYHPSREHDACGVGFVVNIDGTKSRRIIDDALQVLRNIEHRGAEGADPETGDGAGVLMQMPHRFMQRVTSEQGIALPEEGRYAVGMHFLPKDKALRNTLERIIEKIVLDEGQQFLGWRDVPVDNSVPGVSARETLPFIRQSFIGASEEIETQEDFERSLYIIRRIIDNRIRRELHLDRSRYYVPSFSSRTIVYKGMLLADQVSRFFHDLSAPDMESAMAMIHMRFSTNTFPTWDLAHPFRMIAHNGEINTVRGNINWMRTREMVMESPLFGGDLKRILPIVADGQSDSATFDTVLELLVMAGRSLPHAMMMMIPEAWSKNPHMDPDRKGFYEYHANMMEPWDGPAAVAFTDGRVVGATLDRNGLRPARYIVTTDGRVIMASEAGTIHVDPAEIEYSGKLQPGRMFLIDLEKGRIIDDEEIKKEITTQQPYRQWVEDNILRLNNLPEPRNVKEPNHETVAMRQKVFGYTKEDLNIVMRPMSVNGEEALGSMGTDASLAVLSDQPQPLFRYFKQLFAQVTNPPIDAIREEIVMELTTYVGPEQNVLGETPAHAHRLELPHPVLSNRELEQIRSIAEGHFKATTLSMHFDPREKNDMRVKLDALFLAAENAVRSGVNLLILTDRGADEHQAPIPSLLAVAGLHHHLIRQGMRTQTGIILESGEPRDVHHFASLLGYGANAINPYLAYETLHDMFREGLLKGPDSVEKIEYNYRKAIGKGLFKIFSKMGISTLQSYCGAQIFEVVGLDREVVNRFFAGTPTVIEGMSLEMIEEETRRRHAAAFEEISRNRLASGGLHHFRMDGEKHLWTPLTIAKLQNSVRVNNYDEYKEYAKLINEQADGPVTLRSLFEFTSDLPAVSIDEVEPAKEIVKRFATGAMSYGSISREAHTSLAVAMNRLGGQSNTGEGGEEPDRFVPQPNGDSMRSAIKQVASGRFGVTAHYLVNADEIQIKMAQGAKPGEGGQLPGFKVDTIIAKVRHSTPGVTLISPPPHHDIYSIEDLKQLIFDLKNINPTARISVKLVSETGVGTVAAGVAKAHADHILISGHDGGTGASPISSIQYAGTPWELGLSETQQTLVLNGLRDRVYLAVDGQLKTGRDVVVGALLGAEEFGFSTAPLVTLGCIMMRKCHLNTCPVGVATQDPELRAKFSGTPDNVVNFMFFVAEEVREYMAQLGYRKFTDMVGQTHRLQQKPRLTHWKLRGIDLAPLTHQAEPKFGTALHRKKEQEHGLETQLDHKLIELSKQALESGKEVTISLPVHNTDRSVGAMLSGEISKRHGAKALPGKTIRIELTGIAGQSFGVFLAGGVEMRLTGMSNDYTGKGLSGGLLIVRAPAESSFDPAKNIIIGNTCLYGATSGEMYINGMAGERFAVRNSGAKTVIEGVGDHGCEYMTGGVVVVLGETGRNFAAGMSGGIAFVWNPHKKFEKLVNADMVDLEELNDSADLEELHSLISSHYEYTSSNRANFILSNWEEEKSNFVKVMPREYRAALEKLKQLEQAEKEDPSKKMAEVKHG